MTGDSSRYLSDLHNQIDKLFNLEDVKMLCFDLGVDFDNVAGDTKGARIRELILQLSRQNRLPELLDLLRGERPNALWAGPPSDFALPESLATPEAQPPANINYYGPVTFNQQGQTVEGPQINAGGDVNVGQIGDNTGGDMVAGDKFEGDYVAGDQFSIGDINDAQGVAIGSGANAKVHSTLSSVDIASLFHSLKQNTELREFAEPPHMGLPTPPILEVLPDSPVDERFTQARRLEAALPASVRVDETTELLVMLPRIDSPGLSAFLPIETMGGETITDTDVESRSADLQFPAAGEPVTVYISIQASTRDFDIEEPDRAIKVFPDRDGDYETFFLTPLRPSSRAPLTIKLFSDEGHQASLATIRLATAIVGNSTEAETKALLARAKDIIPYVSGSGQVTINIIGGDQTQATVIGSTGTAIGRRSSATVSGEQSGGGTTFEMLFMTLRIRAAEQSPELVAKVDMLLVQVSLGASAEDVTVAGLLQDLANNIPDISGPLKSLMACPEATLAAGGGATSFVLGRL